MAEAHPLRFRVEPQIEESLKKAVQENHRPASSLIEKILLDRLRAEGLLRTGASS